MEGVIARVDPPCDTLGNGGYGSLGGFCYVT